MEFLANADFPLIYDGERHTIYRAPDTWTHDGVDLRDHFETQALKSGGRKVCLHYHFNEEIYDPKNTIEQTLSGLDNDHFNIPTLSFTQRRAQILDIEQARIEWVRLRRAAELSCMIFLQGDHAEIPRLVKLCRLLSQDLDVMAHKLLEEDTLGIEYHQALLCHTLTLAALGHKGKFTQPDCKPHRP